MSPAKTAAERKAAERQRHKEAGRTAVTVHVRPEFVPEVRALEVRLQRRESRKRAAAPEAPTPTAPQPLTDEDICRVGEFDGADEWTYWFARAVEAEVLKRMGEAR